MTTTPDFRAELKKLVDLYEALGGDWSPHGYTDTWNDALASARIALATPPPEAPKNCWLDDEPDLLPSPCVFDDPDEVINNCTYARTVKCKTDCKYYRVTAHPEPVQAPPPEPPTDMALEPSFSQRQQLLQGLSHCFCSTSRHMYLKVWIREYARAALERWGHA